MTGTNPGVLMIGGVFAWTPVIVLIVGLVFVLRLAMKQNLLQRGEWYWSTTSGWKLYGLIVLTAVAAAVVVMTVWRVLQVWKLRPGPDGDWMEYAHDYSSYTIVSAAIGLVGCLLCVPLALWAGRFMFLWRIKYRRSSIADVVSLEIAEQAIQRQAAVDKARRFGVKIDSKHNLIGAVPGREPVTAPVSLKRSDGKPAWAFGVTVPKMLTASAQRNVDWQVGDKMTIPTKPGSARAIILAESGSGKTELMTSLMKCHKTAGHPVVFIDGKAHKDDAEQMEQRLGAEVHYGGYDFFAGSADDILERLMKLVPTTDSTTYYKDEARAVIKEIVATFADDGCDDVDMFKDLWDLAVANEAEELEAGAIPGPYLTEKLQGVMRHRRVWDTLQARLSQVQRFHTAGGWTIASLFEKGGVQMVPVVPEDEADILLANLMLFDLRRYLAVKKRGEKAVPGVMMIDEFAQIVSDDFSDTPAPKMAAQLFETMRSLNMGLYIAGQSVAAMAEDTNLQERLMTTGAAMIIGRGKSSEREAQMFGTVFHGESTGDAEGTAAKSTRAQHTFRVSPEWIRSLPNGVFYFGQSGSVREFFVLPAPR